MDVKKCHQLKCRENSENFGKRAKEEKRYDVERKLGVIQTGRVVAHKVF